MAGISAKQKALELVERLPLDATLEEVIEPLYLLHKVERGLTEADAGDTVSHEEALAEREQWRVYGGADRCAPTCGRSGILWLAMRRVARKCSR